MTDTTVPEHCPRCGSYQIGSNEIALPDAQVVMHSSTLARRGGHPAMAALGLLAWGSLHIANALRPKWRCNQCHHSFS